MDFDLDEIGAIKQVNFRFPHEYFLAHFVARAILIFNLIILLFLFSFSTSQMLHHFFPLVLQCCPNFINIK